MTNQNAADIFVISIVVMVGAVAFIAVGVYVILPCAIVFGIYKLIQYLTRPKPPTTQELYEKAQVTYFPSDADFTKNFVEKMVDDDAWECPTDNIIDRIINMARELYRSENLALTPLLAPREGTIEEARYRDQLINQSARATNPLAIIDLVQTTLSASINIFLKALPPAAFTEDEPKYTIPLNDTLPNLPKLVEEITYPFFQQSLYDTGLFKGLRQRLVANGDAVNEKKVVMPEDYKGDDIIRTYLGGTPLEQLFAAQIPIVIPQEAYFEGQWIVAPPGAGTTQFIQSQIIDILPKVMEGKASIIVMDSQEQLIRNIQGLNHFVASDKLVMIDANDIESPVALNIFDLGMGDNLSPLEKERTLNAALELTMFLLDSLLGSDLTGKQAVVFRFIMQAIFAISNATIYTLEELLSVDARPNRNNTSTHSMALQNAFLRLSLTTKNL